MPSVKALQDGFTLSNAQAKAEFDRRNFESESAIKLSDCQSNEFFANDIFGASVV